MLHKKFEAKVEKNSQKAKQKEKRWKSRGNKIRLEN